MGLQQSCLDRQDTNQLGDNLQELKIIVPKLSTGMIQCNPYKLNQQAQRTYSTLITKFNSQYLDIKSNKEESQNVKEYQGYFKLGIYDACYHGQWKNAKPHGKGIAIFPKGSILVGIFIQGYCQGGQNYYFYEEGSFYIGNMNQNQIKGKGKFVNQNITYQGEWNQNLPHGQGIEIYSNGDKYAGRFQKGVKQGIDSVFTWKNHQRYIQYKGQFKEGKINGLGVLTLKDKISISGFFNEDVIQNCTFDSNKYKFSGKYQNGKMEGEGKLEILQAKQTFYGNFKNGKMLGQFKVKDAKERQLDTYFFNNKQLRKVHGLSDSQVQKIVKIVEAAFESASRNSEALVDICQDLEDEYQCKFIEPFENLFNHSNYAMFNIYNNNKVLLIKAKRSQAEI